MIIPEKHLDLDLSVLRAGAVMLKVLKKDRRVELPAMREKLVKKLGADAELIFHVSDELLVSDRTAGIPLQKR